MNDIQDEIKKHVQSMPLRLQRAIGSVEINEPLREIYQKYSLNLDQASALETEAALVAVGLESGQNFVDSIIENVEVSEIDAIAISKEINDKIVGQITKNLRNSEYDSKQNTDDSSRSGILDGIEKPHLVGSKIRKIKTPYTEKNVDGNFIQSMTTNKATAEEQEVQEPTLSSPQDKLTKPVDSLNETEGTPNATRKYPGGDDPYREMPV